MSDDVQKLAVPNRASILLCNLFAWAYFTLLYVPNGLIKKPKNTKVANLICLYVRNKTKQWLIIVYVKINIKSTESTNRRVRSGESFCLLCAENIIMKWWWRGWWARTRTHCAHIKIKNKKMMAVDKFWHIQSRLAMLLFFSAAVCGLCRKSVSFIFIRKFSNLCVRKSEATSKAFLP